jgi:hypothetical protein
MRPLIPSCLLAGAVALALGGCAGGDDPTTGQLSLAVTDAPVDEAEHVVVAFTGVELKPANGPSQTFHYCLVPVTDEELTEDGATEELVVQTEACETPGTRQIDLLALHGGGSELILDDVTVPAGRYNWVRLMVVPGYPDSYITLSDGGDHDLDVPSGELKLVQGFVVPAGGSASFTIDFDLRKAVTDPVGQEGYKLRPALRLVDNVEVGSIQGTVAAELVHDASCTDDNGGAVYVWNGVDATPMDIRDENGDPITTAMVRMNDEGAYVYRAAFLPGGDYTVAFTCQAVDDDPEAADEIAFVEAANVTVTAGQNTVHHFGVDPVE